jgi:hypothetical protein
MPPKSHTVDDAYKLTVEDAPDPADTGLINDRSLPVRRNPV